MKKGIATAVGILLVVVAGWGLMRWLQQDEATLPDDSDQIEATEEAANQFQQLAPSDGFEEESLLLEEEAVLDAEISADDEVTIEMTDTGFEPSELVIGAGTSVRFVNNGQAAHWPASDVHPTHQILPEFDSKKGLATGESYTYTFTEVGEWNMHDHLFPQFKGMIVVE